MKTVEKAIWTCRLIRPLGATSKRYADPLHNTSWTCINWAKAIDCICISTNSKNICSINYNQYINIWCELIWYICTNVRMYVCTYVNVYKSYMSEYLYRTSMRFQSHPQITPARQFFLPAGLVVFQQLLRFCPQVVQRWDELQILAACWGVLWVQLWWCSWDLMAI